MDTMPPKPPKKLSRRRSVLVRLDIEIVEEIDEIVARLEETRPESRTTRAGVCATFIEAGITAYRGRSAPSGKGGRRR